MKVIDRYIGSAAAAGTLLALLVLLALDGLFAFVGEIPDIGRVDYGILQAVTFVLMTLPRRAFDLFPTAALLGALLGVGSLAVSSELVALRAAGVSRHRISGAALIACGLLSLPMLAVGEWVAPPAEQAAQELRVTRQARDLSLGGPSGLWVRSGDQVINAERLLESGALSEITVYQFDADSRLSAVTRAALAQPEGDGWRLSGVKRTAIAEEAARTMRRDSDYWDELVDPELLRVAVLKPEDLSVASLTRYIEYLRGNGLDAYRYELAFWGRVVYPFVVLALVIAGLPFVFGSLRQGGLGVRVFLGIVIGLLFFLLNRTLGRFGAVYELDPLLISALPPLLVAGAAWLYLRRPFA